MVILATFLSNVLPEGISPITIWPKLTDSEPLPPPMFSENGTIIHILPCMWGFLNLFLLITPIDSVVMIVNAVLLNNGCHPPLTSFSLIYF